MNDTPGKMLSSLTVGDKQYPKLGGCVGVFFQLFDWNRRLSRKQFFPHKLLAAERPRHVTRKGQEDKLPMAKLLLIADENRGGFPEVLKKESSEPPFPCPQDSCADGKNLKRAPGVVARLMGLESMPSPQIGRPTSEAFTESKSKRMELPLLEKDFRSASRTPSSKVEGRANQKTQFARKRESENVRAAELEQQNITIWNDDLNLEMPISIRKRSPLNSRTVLFASKSHNSVSSPSRSLPGATNFEASAKASEPNKLPLPKAFVATSENLKAKPRETPTKNHNSKAFQTLKGQSLSKSWDGPDLKQEYHSGRLVTKPGRGKLDEYASNRKIYDPKIRSDGGETKIPSKSKKRIPQHSHDRARSARLDKKKVELSAHLADATKKNLAKGSANKEWRSLKERQEGRVSSRFENASNAQQSVSSSDSSQTNTVGENSMMKTLLRRRAAREAAAALEVGLCSPEWELQVTERRQKLSVGRSEVSEDGSIGEFLFHGKRVPSIKNRQTRTLEDGNEKEIDDLGGIAAFLTRIRDGNSSDVAMVSGCGSDCGISDNISPQIGSANTSPLPKSINFVSTQPNSVNSFNPSISNITKSDIISPQIGSVNTSPLPKSINTVSPQPNSINSFNPSISNITKSDNISPQIECVASSCPQSDSITSFSSTICNMIPQPKSESGRFKSDLRISPQTKLSTGASGRAVGKDDAANLSTARISEVHDDQQRDTSDDCDNWAETERQPSPVSVLVSPFDDENGSMAATVDDNWSCDNVHCRNITDEAAYITAIVEAATEGQPLSLSLRAECWDVMCAEVALAGRVSFAKLEERMEVNADAAAAGWATAAARRVVFDCVEEALAAREVWTKASHRAKEPRQRQRQTQTSLLARVVQEHVRGWGDCDSVGVGGGDEMSPESLVALEVSKPRNRWSEFPTEVSEIVSGIERAIVRLLVDELVHDISPNNRKPRSPR